MKSKHKVERQINNYISGVYTQEEALKVLDIMKKDEHNEHLEKCMVEAWTESESWTQVSADKRQLRNEAYDLLHAEKRKYIVLPRKYFQRTISVAASVVIAVSLSVIGYNYLSTTDVNQSYVEESTVYGETKDVILPDGTKVTLNSCSYISYPDKFGEQERLINLDGEAYFDVQKNEKLPFIISTHKFKVQVLGTEFNVKAYQGDIIQSVNVEGGKVQVDMPDAMVRLIASEQIDMNTKTEEYIKYKDVHKVATWRKGDLQFNKTPIRDVTNELERIYKVKITYQKGKVFNNLITGEHSNTSLTSVLGSLTATADILFKYDKEKEEVYIYR